MLFGKLDDPVARRSDISSNAKVVFAVLRRFENSKTRQCNPTQEALAAGTGMGRRSVSRAIAELRDMGLLTTLRSRNGLNYVLPDTPDLGISDTPDLGITGSDTPDLGISDTPDLGITGSDTPDLGISDTPDLGITGSRCDRSGRSDTPDLGTVIEEDKTNDKSTTSHTVPTESRSTPKATHSKDIDPGFTPDPAYDHNALYDRWRKSGLTIPRSETVGSGQSNLKKLHWEEPHWSLQDVERAMDILAEDKRSNRNQLEWVWSKGPGYLWQDNKGMQVVEKVLTWRVDRPKSSSFPANDDYAGASDPSIEPYDIKAGYLAKLKREAKGRR